jgi:hypothetical protein
MRFTVGSYKHYHYMFKKDLLNFRKKNLSSYEQILHKNVECVKPRNTWNTFVRCILKDLETECYIPQFQNNCMKNSLALYWL